MDIILWRHADAEAGFPDEARKLTPKGEKQAEHIAKWLKERLPKNTKVLVSPAKRTQMTVQHLTNNYETVKAIASGASVKSVLDAIGGLDGDSDDIVLIVGHQPTLGMVAASLLGQRDTQMDIKKSGVWWFRYDDDGISLLAVMTPDMV